MVLSIRPAQFVAIVSCIRPAISIRCEIPAITPNIHDITGLADKNSEIR